MKVLIEFDLSEHWQENLYQRVRAEFHSHTVDQTCQTAGDTSTVLGAGITEHPPVDVAEVRSALAKLQAERPEDAFRLITQMQQTYGVGKLADLNGTQLAVLKLDIEKMTTPESPF